MAGGLCPRLRTLARGMASRWLAAIPPRVAVDHRAGARHRAGTALRCGAGAPGDCCASRARPAMLRPASPSNASRGRHGRLHLTRRVICVSASCSRSQGSRSACSCCASSPVPASTCPMGCSAMPASSWPPAAAVPVLDADQAAALGTAARAGGERAVSRRARGGDDYELCFTVPPLRRAALEAAARGACGCRSRASGLPGHR
jgi:hypothetical protein